MHLNNVKTLSDRLCIEPMLSKFWPPNIDIGFALPLHTKSVWLIMYCQVQYTWYTKYFIFSVLRRMCKEGLTVYNCLLPGQLICHLKLELCRAIIKRFWIQQIGVAQKLIFHQ